MAKIGDWCNRTKTTVNGHVLAYFEAEDAKIPQAVTNLAAIVPDHYATASRVARILGTLGKPAAARYVSTKLPAGPRSRSGDIGEILASSWVAEFTDFDVGIFKLRWKDHREMSMRGDDILALCRDPKVEVRFLKGEVKSRARLSKATIVEARTALLSSNGRPTPHALAYVSDRLYESGQTDLSDLVDRYQLSDRIKLAQLSHLMFVFTGNSAQTLLSDDLKAYGGRVKQHAVGVRVKAHPAFVTEIFDKVIANGHKP